MIHPYGNESMTRWDRGELKVKIVNPANGRAVAYCDGTEEDEADLLAIAESEGAELQPIQRKVLRTGREIWTMGEPPDAQGEDDC